MNTEMEGIKSIVISDIQGIMKDFENSDFVNEINRACKKLKSVTSFFDVSGVASLL